MPSPCIDICRMDPETGLCQGCWRTMQEIAGWGMADDQEKREVHRRIAQRKDLAGKKTNEKG